MDEPGAVGAGLAEFKLRIGAVRAGRGRGRPVEGPLGPAIALFVGRHLGSISGLEGQAGFLKA